jgi:hypothetical protein
MDKASIIPAKELSKIEYIIRHNADSFFEHIYNSLDHAGISKIKGKLTIQDILLSSVNIKIHCKDDTQLHTFIFTHLEFDRWYNSLENLSQSDKIPEKEYDQFRSAILRDEYCNWSEP